MSKIKMRLVRRLLHKCGVHIWKSGHAMDDYFIYCEICDGESTVSPFGYAPRFFDGGIRWFKNYKGFTKDTFKRLPAKCFYNLIKELKIKE